MNAFTIKDVENLSGVKAHTIRIWEQRYDFLKPQRTDTNIRYYSNEELKTILNIALLNKYGFKISHINKMDFTEINQKLVSLSHHYAQQEWIVNQLISFMVDLDLDLFEELLDSQIEAKGLEKIINEIIFPFLQKIGILWLTNNINPAQEHLVTNIVRQKLLVGIETTVSQIKSEKVALLFLPEGEFHELGLLYVYYLLKNRGVKVLYLGADVPLQDVDFIAKAKKPDYLYTHLTSLAANFNIEKFLNHLHSRISDIPVLLSGPFTVTYKKSIPSNFHFKKSLEEVKEYIS
ncbi:MerR family transcriptional regulator [Segetibacter aerophilus]|uniref:MerR family transcriptional regulator n=1 Tax=Segetibacter aerophilus TaxID=670293 RepID=A0A512BI37_9BACT|nr:MerR family transcriptional regulator [Segetibacter aerophilus]GEO11632.1 MerR family transcriptional regulator [Segetibacter aerophilus]